MSERYFPIQDAENIPWSIIAPQESHALRNHDQTLERLAQRGGLGAAEAIAVLRGEGYRQAMAYARMGNAAQVLRGIVKFRRELQIEELEAENARLRAALEEVQAQCTAGEVHLARIAYGALNPDG